MKTSELACIFEGLISGLSSSLPPSTTQELERVRNLLGRFPNQKVSEFVDFVDGALDESPRTVPGLVSRIELLHSGNRSNGESAGETRETLWEDLQRTSGSDLVRVVSALKQPCSTEKQQNLQVLRRYLFPEREGVAVGAGHPGGLEEAVASRARGSRADHLAQRGEDGLPEAARHVVRQYRDFRDSIATTSLQEIRAWIQTLQKLPDDALWAAVQFLGYQAEPTKEKNVGKLRYVLEFLYNTRY